MKTNLPDRIFLIVFGILLFVPMLHINQAEFSKKEKRRLAVFPTLITENGINASYGKSFESWFDDRFFLRKQIIHLFDKYRYSLSSDENQKALIGKDDWAFYKGDNSVSNYQNATLLSQDELEKITANLNDIQNFAKQNNQRFVFLIGPDKNKAYGEFFSEKYKKQRPDSESRTVQLLNYLKLHSDVRAVYPLDVINAGKDKGLLYYKDDTHWNDLGAYLAYREMMKSLDIKPVVVSFKQKTRGGGKGDLATMIRLKSSVYSRIEYPTVATPLSGQCKAIGKTTLGNSNFLCTNPNRKGKAIVFRDSFTTAVQPYLAETFNEVKLYWHHNIKDIAPSELKQYDVIILEAVERAVPRLTEMHEKN